MQDLILERKVDPMGRITIPKDIRKILGIEIGDKVGWQIQEGHLILVPDVKDNEED